MWRSAVQVCLGLRISPSGGLAQLARAPALQAGGQRFESVILHKLVFVDVFVFVATEFFDILTHKTVSKDFKSY